MIVDLTDTDLRNTWYFQDVFAEGQLEGREEGRRSEAIGFVLRLLCRRLGPLSGETEQRIATLTVPQIEALGEALLDFTQPPALTEWLKQHG
jgi:predicted transposase YdaD